MIEEIAKNQNIYLDTKSDEELKKYGQFFTGHEIATYMASMIDLPHFNEVRIMDAGAGAGILSYALAIRLLDESKSNAYAELYETDADVIPLLQKSMDQLVKLFEESGRSFSYKINNCDFILTRPDISTQNFDLASINPPYFKYNSKTSCYANKTKDLFKGNPNIYASFMAVVSECLSPEGQMVAIVPRSFTNGLYFKGFRNFLIRKMSLEKLHVFRSRNQIFKEKSVLQENIICHYKKKEQNNFISIATSNGLDFDNVKSIKYKYNKIIDEVTQHDIIRIPETKADAEILGMVERWHCNFQQLGYFISTGPVVEHRTRQYIKSASETTDTAILLRMHNIKMFRTIWTGKHKKDARFRLNEGHERHTTINQPYVILKRFSSKEEKRRLVAGVHDPESIDSKILALENHLNYIGRKEGSMDLNEAIGLAALLNSTLMDKYFRCISGSTQVNATEIRFLKLPERKVIKTLGAKININDSFTQEDIDKTVEECLVL